MPNRIIDKLKSMDKRCFMCYKNLGGTLTHSCEIIIDENKTLIIKVLSTCKCGRKNTMFFNYTSGNYFKMNFFEEMKVIANRLENDEIFMINNMMEVNKNENVVSQ